MIKFAYVVPEDEAGFTKYIVQNLFWTIWTNVISNIFG